MRLSSKAVEKFKEIYLQEYGEEITDEEAQAMGIKLLRLFAIIYKPIPKSYEADKQLAMTK